MSKKFIALLIVFFITFAAFIYTEFFYLTPLETDAIPLEAESTTASNGTVSNGAILYFSPNPLTTSASSSAQMNVVLETNTKPDLIQLEIGFDPKILFNVDITPGDYFINPEIVLFNIDIKNGRISYALSGEPNPNNANTVAVITFNTYNYGVSEETGLSFLPKTSVKMDSKVIELKKTPEATIITKP